MIANLWKIFLLLVIIKIIYIIFNAINSDNFIYIYCPSLFYKVAVTFLLVVSAALIVIRSKYNNDSIKIKRKRVVKVCGSIIITMFFLVEMEIYFNKDPQKYDYIVLEYLKRKDNNSKELLNLIAEASKSELYDYIPGTQLLDSTYSKKECPRLSQGRCIDFKISNKILAYDGVLQNITEFFKDSCAAINISCSSSQNIEFCSTMKLINYNSILGCKSPIQQRRLKKVYLKSVDKDGKELFVVEIKANRDSEVLH